MSLVLELQNANLTRYYTNARLCCVDVGIDVEKQPYSPSFLCVLLLISINYTAERAAVL